MDVVVNASILLAIFEWDFDDYRKTGVTSHGGNPPGTPLTPNPSHDCAYHTGYCSCAKRGDHVKLCPKPRGACGMESQTSRRRDLLWRIGALNAISGVDAYGVSAHVDDL